MNNYSFPKTIHKLAFEEMNDKQAEETFNWFMENIPTRMEYFRSRCSNDLKIPKDKLDYSADSLLLVWKWFLKNEKRVKTTRAERKEMSEGAKIFGQSYINLEKFADVTKYMIYDIALYVGQCYINNYNSLYWDYTTRPKSSVTVNQPRVAGFIAEYKGKKGTLTFPVIHMVETQAANIFFNEQDVNDLKKVYTFWTQYIPSSENYNRTAPFSEK